MDSLQIIMVVCPLMTADLNNCEVGVENPVVLYKDLKKCTERAKEIHEKAALAIYQAGAVLRVGCVDKRFFEIPKPKRKKDISA
jgi:hypothetical protein